MYNALILLSTVLAVILLALAAKRQSRALTLVGGALLVATPLAFTTMDLWGELLWFRSLGQEARAWREVGLRVGSVLLGALLAALGVALLTRPLREQAPSSRATAIALSLVMGAGWGHAHWSTLALFLGGVDMGLAEPVLGKDAGFYLFTLPYLDALRGLAFVTAVIALGLVLVAERRPDESSGALEHTPPDDAGDGQGEVAGSGGGDALRDALPAAPAPASALLRGLAALGVVLAARQLLARYHVLHSRLGVVTGAGWSDVHVRLPAYWLSALAFLLAGLLPLLPPVRRRLRALGTALLGATSPPPRRDLVGAGGLWLGAIALTVAGLLVTPMLTQWLLVAPNEVTYEKPYIGHNIRFTRRAFDLHDAEVRHYPVGDELTRQDLDENQDILDEIRLWDYRALGQVFAQFQQIRLYYEFYDVDVDRYRIGDRYRQVMVSARELTPWNLPEDSQTFVNRRFVFTHGYGLAMTDVSEFTPEGLPDLLIRDLPPEVAHESLGIDQPQIYYGELTAEPVVVNSSEQEFDYPRGDENVYAHYQGTGGVPMGSLWRRFLFGWKFDGTRLFMSNYPRPGSRIMFHRRIRERVSRLAPFLTLDADPYVVLADGRLYWIVDAYTRAENFPYSEPLPGAPVRLAPGEAAPLAGANYVRNAVKAVVNAHDGSVTLYVFEPDDPVIRAWRRVFPGLFEDAAEMPAVLRAHVRYPADLLRRQGQVFAKYHMTDPAVFYNQEDLWMNATEKYDGRVQAVEPYYVMWQPPDGDEAEFVLMQPFTPKGRQVMVGWIAGRCDGEHYGRFLAYKFPKDRRVLGPQQVETKIDQDRFLSGQLSLWDQRGSSVIRGNVLAIPLEDTMLYVEPIYLEAETAAYPELRLVVLMHGDRLTYAPTFDEALRRLVGAGEAEARRAAGRPLAERAADAQDAFEDYLRHTGKERFDEAAKALGKLREALSDLTLTSPGQAR